MQTKPKVSAMKRETIKGNKVIKQVAVKTPRNKIMVVSESGKPQSLADRTARANAFANELSKVKAMGASSKMDASKVTKTGMMKSGATVKYPKKK